MENYIVIAQVYDTNTGTLCQPVAVRRMISYIGPFIVKELL